MRAKSDFCATSKPPGRFFIVTKIVVEHGFLPQLAIFNAHLIKQETKSPASANGASGENFDDFGMDGMGKGSLKVRITHSTSEQEKTLR